MQAVQFRTDAQVDDHVADGPFPWEQGRAAPEDRALGLELELIELVHRRDVLHDDRSIEARGLEREIDQTMGRLAAITPVVAVAG